MDAKRLLAAFLIGSFLAAVGYALGQFAPFTGLAQLAEPFTPLRNQTAYIYAAVGGVVGMLLGFSLESKRG